MVKTVNLSTKHGIIFFLITVALLILTLYIFWGVLFEKQEETDPVKINTKNVSFKKVMILQYKFVNLEKWVVKKGKSIRLAGKRYHRIIKNACRRYGMDLKLIKAVIIVESDYNPEAVSTTGAKGLMQLQPAAAKDMGVNDRVNPWENIMGGTKYLRWLLDMFGNNIDAALMAYYEGPNKAKKLLLYGFDPSYHEQVIKVKEILKHL